MPENQNKRERCLEQDTYSQCAIFSFEGQKALSRSLNYKNLW